MGQVCCVQLYSAQYTCTAVLYRQTVPASLTLIRGRDTEISGQRDSRGEDLERGAEVRKQELIEENTIS